MRQVIKSDAESADGVGGGGMTSTPFHESSRTMATTFIRALIDHELQLDELATISGGGNKAKTKVGQWFEKIFGMATGSRKLVTTPMK